MKDSTTQPANTGNTDHDTGWKVITTMPAIILMAGANKGT